jgi:hypothetical protein
MLTCGVTNFINPTNFYAIYLKSIPCMLLCEFGEKITGAISTSYFFIFIFTMSNHMDKECSKSVFISSSGFSISSFVILEVDSFEKCASDPL